MLLPNQFIVLLILVPIFVDSSPQLQVYRNHLITGCTDHSQCGTARYCNGLGSCAIDPCSVSHCRPGNRCVVVQGGRAVCQRIVECTEHSQCRNTGYCNSFGSCVVNPCSLAHCEAGTKCQLVQGKANCQRLKECTEYSQCRNTGYCNSFGSCVVNPCSLARCEAGTKCQLVQGKANCQRLKECNDDTHCEDDELCVSRSCVNSCNLVQCREGASCSVRQREPQCLCPSPTLQNSVAPCLPLQGCVTNSQCRENEQCQSGVCVDLCNSVQCGQRAFCQVFDRKPKCYCPANTQGDPNDQCLPKQANGVGNRQSDGNQESVLTSGTQGVSQVGVNEEGNQGGSNQAANHGSTAQGSNQGGVGQGDHQVQGDAAQGGHQGDTTQDSNQGGAIQESNQSVSAQEGNQGVATHGANQSGSAQDGNQEVGSSAVTTEGTGNITNPPSPGSNRTVASVSGCRINSQCGSNKRCKSGSCVDPCDSVKCGLGAICQVSQRQPRCVCPAGTEGDPLEQCQPISDIQGCAENSQCAENEQCDLGNCVNPCELIPSCGKGAKCQVLGRNPQCICPANTQGDPFKQCEPVQAPNVAFPGDKPTQIPPINVPGKGTRNPGCLNVPDPGECRGAFKRFYYNEQTDQCDCFLFGGCDVEGVKFTWVTLEECQRICLPGKKDQGPGCKRATLDEVTLFLEEQRRNRESIRG